MIVADGAWMVQLMHGVMRSHFDNYSRHLQRWHCVEQDEMSVTCLATGLFPAVRQLICDSEFEINRTVCSSQAANMQRMVCVRMQGCVLTYLRRHASSDFQQIVHGIANVGNPQQR